MPLDNIKYNVIDLWRFKDVIEKTFPRHAIYLHTIEEKEYVCKLYELFNYDWYYGNKINNESCSNVIGLRELPFCIRAGDHAMIGSVNAFINKGVKIITFEQFINTLNINLTRVDFTIKGFDLRTSQEKHKLFLKKLRNVYA